MSTHSLTVTHVYVHETGKTSKRKALDDVGPEHDDLLHLWHGVFKDYSAANDSKMRYLSVTKAIPAGRTLVLETDVGRYAEPGNTKNVLTHAVEHQRTHNSSSTIPARVVFLIPPGAESGLIFFEHVGRSSAAPEVLDILQRAFRHRYELDLMLKTETLVESDAWITESDLEEVTVTAYGWDHDIAGDGHGKVVGTRKTTFEPPPGSSVFPRWWWELLRDKTVARATVLGFEETEDIDEIRVRATGNGREKTFVLGKDRRPSVRYLVAEDVTEPPTTAELLHEAVSHAGDLFPRVSGEWQSAWVRGTWTPAQRQLSMEVPQRV